MSSLQQLLNEIESLSTTWDVKVKAADLITANFGKRAVVELISLLQSKIPDTRNAAALALREIGDNRAVEPLFSAIQCSENLSDRSTLVYALENLDCSANFAMVFSLLFSDKIDVRTAAANIFFEQGFYVDDKSIEAARKRLEIYPLHDEFFKAVRQRLLDFE